MEFMQSGPDIVRSDHQRWLLDYWASQRGPGSLPIWRGLNANDFAVPFDNLAWMEVVGVDGDARFRIEFHGRGSPKRSARSSASASSSTNSCRRRISAPRIATYRQVMSTKGPVYTVSDMRDPTGRIVHHERLLLPFSLGGAETERILASIEAVEPGRAVRAAGPDEITNPPAGNCALHDDPILE